MSKIPSYKYIVEFLSMLGNHNNLLLIFGDFRHVNIIQLTQLSIRDKRFI